jgi:hypothetical protein
MEARTFYLKNNTGRHWNADSDLRIEILCSFSNQIQCDLMEHVVTAAIEDQEWQEA